MKHSSASGSESLVMCPSSVVLPQHDSYGGDAREKGTSGHSILTGVVNGTLPASALADKWPSLGFKLAEIMPRVESSRAEAAYVVDLERRTSTFLGINIDRKYVEKLGRPFRMFEMGVSLDFHGVRPGIHVVRDWKFGLYSSWWQLFVQGMAVMWTPGQTGALEVDAGFIHIIEGSEDEDGGETQETYVFDDTATLYMADLDDRADDLIAAIRTAKALEDEVAAGRPLHTLPTREGKWCEYCGAYPHCPSKQKLVRALAELDVSDVITAMTPAQCGAAYKKLVEVEKNIIKKAKASLKHRLKIEESFPLDNGKRLRMVEMPGRDSLDKPKLMALLREKGATQAEINDCFKTGAPFFTIKETR